MYKTKDYIRNGVLYLNNMLRPRHKVLSTLMLYSTTKCQSRCKHCSIWQKPVEHLSTLMGVPIEKVFQRKRVDVHLFDRNNFVPTIHNNQIVTQGYFDTIKSFVDAVEKRKSSSEQSLEAIIDTYKLIESIRSIQN